MLLAIDVGNTNIHFGLHNGQEWCGSWRARTVPNKMGDEYAVLLRNFLAETGHTFGDIDAIALASVVPNLTPTLMELGKRYTGQTPLNVAPGIKTGIKVLVDNPHETGADRVVNAVAAKMLYGSPAIVVDFGTSTNFDVVNADGNYIGGALASGVGLAHDALVSRAARLVKVDLAAPPSAIGHNTIHAMQSGIFLGHVAMVEGLVARIRAALDAPDALVIATGGLAPLFAGHTDVIDEIAPTLTLDGVRLVWELNR